MSVGRWRSAWNLARGHWPLIRRVATAAFILAVLTLIGTLAVRIDWVEVWNAIAAYRSPVLGTAAALVIVSFTVYSTFDLMARAYTGHDLSWWRTMLVCFVSYAFTLNLGAPVGAVGMRFRLYCKQGLGKGLVGGVMAFSLATNWLGYLWLGGLVFAAGALELPDGWQIGSAALRLIGVAMVLCGFAYLCLCHFCRRRSWVVRGYRIELPSLRLALLQCFVAACNWALMAAIIYVLLLQKVDYPTVLTILLLSAIAGALMHIPGGLGVTESVFVALLSGIPRPEVLGALLVYRALYYLAPLAVAGMVYLLFETGVTRWRELPPAGQGAR